MRLADRSASVVEIHVPKWAGLRRAPLVPHLDVVLKPLSRPKLGEIRLDDAVFVIGRTEQPFASYGNDVINMLSRRQARIFRKDGFVYLEDLESRNGTTVNRVRIGHAPYQLSDGDEICFGGALSYRVQITPRIRPEGSLTLTLMPESGDSGLDTIVITKFPFLVSKADATFSHYKGKSEHGPELGYVSRRHAYIYQKGSQAYIEDLGSGNGTFVDGLRLLEHAVPLQDGVVVAFGGKHFVYRVSITRESATEPAHSDGRNPLAERKPNAPHVERAHSGAGNPLAERKPNVPQANDARNPLAERKSNTPPANDGNDARTPLAERKSIAPRANDGNDARTPLAERKPIAPQANEANGARNLLAERKPTGPQTNEVNGARSPLAERKPNVPQLEPAHSGDRNQVAECNPDGPQAYEGTQFMAAPTSFLTILCHAPEPKDDVAPGGAAAPAPATKEPVVKRPRGRAMLLLSELASLHVNGEPESARRKWWKAAAVASILGALASTAYFWSASERDLNNAVARGEYARAAVLASQLLEKHPDNVEVKALATDATLKANVPAWLVKVRARDFDGVKGVLAGMSALVMRDADLRPLIDELEWLGNLERLVSGRGGPEAPIRIYADEDGIEHLIGRWNDDTGEHQRALARIAAHVPQFGDWYGEALTHLRRLQSESTVYLPIIERIKSNIASELEKDNPEALKPVLKETAQKYPGLGGLDNARQDLARYIEIRQEARSRKSGRLFALLRKARFVTPPFEQSFRGLMESGQLPSTALLQQYDAATQAWKGGNPTEALAALQKMTAGPWGEDAAKELERRRGVTARFAAIQESRNVAGFVDQLLAFRESLDADEDVYFVRATATDLNLQRDDVIARAQEAMNRARTLWQEYQSNGAIDASQRIETSMSDEFRTRARLLAEASRYAQRGLLIYSQVDAAGAAQWTAIREEIESEAREQVSRLHDLSNVVEPGLLKAKLALLGDPNE
jgi:pSer/pThr/pTyr-binding forkhead associated (FHA) protein